MTTSSKASHCPGNDENYNRHIISTTFKSLNSKAHQNDDTTIFSFACLNQPSVDHHDFASVIQNLQYSLAFFTKIEIYPIKHQFL